MGKKSLNFFTLNNFLEKYLLSHKNNWEMEKKSLTFFILNKVLEKYVVSHKNMGSELCLGDLNFRYFKFSPMI